MKPVQIDKKAEEGPVKCTAFSYEDAYFFPVPADPPAFWVNMAGIDYCNDSYSMYRARSNVTVLEFVYEGTGTLWIDGKEYHPSAGDVYIMPKGTKQTYYPDKHDPWVKIWVNLAGTAVPSLVQAFGLQRVIYKNCEPLASTFEEILHEVLQNGDVEQMMERCAMLVMKILNRLSLSSSAREEEQQRNPVPQEVQQVRSFIDSNYRKNLTMDDIAAAVYRSNDYVKKQFKQCYGITPYAYYLDLKLTHAKYLLRQTNLPIKQIADKLGYKSDRYFSKRFREIVGVTATQYRNSVKTQGK